MSAQYAAELESLVAGSVASVTGTLPIQSSGGLNPDISILPSTPLQDGSMSSTQAAQLAALVAGTANALAIYTNGARPAANAVGAIPGVKAIVIWNSTEMAPEYSDGVNWYDASGNMTGQ
jgi:hypothetical protein